MADPTRERLKIGVLDRRRRLTGVAESEPIRIAVLGVGRMGRVHATNLAPMDDIEVVAFDPAFDRHDLSDVSCLMAGRSPNLCPATAATEAQNVAIAALRSLAEGAAVDVRAG